MQSPQAAVLVALPIALLVGILSAAISPLVAFAGIVALVVFAAVVARPVLGLFLFVIVVALFPFGVVPLRIGVELTFLDTALLSTYVGLLGAYLSRLPRPPFTTSLAGWLLLLFMGAAILSLIIGNGYSPVDPDELRRFAKLLASLGVFFLALLLVRSPRAVASMTRALILAAAIAGGVAAVLWRLPTSIQLRLLTSLAVIGYPTADVLRYVPGPNNSYTTQLRATGTAIDPNVLGGTVMMGLLLAIVQIAAPRRVFNRPILVVLALPALAGVVTSFSRASWVGVAVALAVIATCRFRRLWIVLALGAVVALTLPVGRDAVVRFTSGLSSSDPATALRFGEYHNALTLIQRYPLFGVGFGAAPDFDVTAGVSSVYLLMGEQTGLLGLALYVATLGVVIVVGFQAVLRAARHPDSGLVAAYFTAVLGALVAGVFDHYFANQAFPHAVALFWLYAGLLLVTARSVMPSSVQIPPLGARVPSHSGSSQGSQNDARTAGARP